MSNHQNKLGLATGIASILGLMLLGTSFLTITQGISMGGYVFFIALSISWFLMMCQATSFAELSSIMPSEGAVYNYVAAGMGRFMGVTATLAAYVIVTIFASSAEVAIAGIFARTNFEFLQFIPEGQTYLIGWFIVLICVAINIRGIDFYAKAEIFMSFFKYIVMVVLGLVGLFLVKKVNLDFVWGTSAIGTDMTALFSLVGLTLFLFVGAEYVTPLAPEMKNHHKDIPRSLFIGLTLSIIAMFIFGTSVAWQVPNEIVDEANGVRLLDTPEAALIFGESVAGTIGKWGFAIIIFIATVALINTLIASIPRILWGMAQDGMLPAVFGKLHPKYETPWVGILFIGIIPMIGSFWVGDNIDGVISLILSAICSWIFFYILINISVILLRRKRPDLSRSYKVPLFPIPQIIASLGLVITFFYLAPPNISAGQIYIPFFIMLGLCAIYAFFRIQQSKKANLWASVSVEDLMKKEQKND